MYLHTYRQTEDRQADRQTDTYVYVQIERERWRACRGCKVDGLEYRASG